VEIYGKPLKMIVLLWLIVSIAQAQDYALNTYDGASSEGLRNVKTIFVNLETRSVISSIVIGQQGQIMNKTPLRIGFGTDRYLINAVMEGCFCQNSMAGDEDRVRITIIGEDNSVIEASYTEQGLGIIYFTQGPDASVYIYAESTEGQPRHMNGDFTLNSEFELSLRTQRPSDYNPLFSPGTGDFPVIQRMSAAYNLYKSWISGRRFILKLNHDTGGIIDSLELQNNPVRTHVLAVLDSLLYVFHQNYEFYGKTIQKGPDDDRIDSHLLIYNAFDFSLLDSISIPDYPPGDYIGGEFGSADVVGPYIVYYYFEGEGIDRFAPAMLLIFDTRTNEATWLRVGWR
jgi:hypothetical protein